MNTKQSSLAAFVAIVTLMTVGCTGSAVTQVPGSLNPVDSAAYVALKDSQSAIQTFHDPVANSGNATLIQVYDDFVKAYNAAETAYQAYHAAAKAGTASPQQTADMQASVAAMTAARLKVGPLPATK